MGGVIALVTREFRRAVGRLAAESQERARVEQAARDLELQRALARAASTAKSAFVATLSHELRTPTHGIVGHAEALLAVPELDAGSRRSVGVILESTRHLLDLIDDSLDQAAIEAGRVVLRPASIAPGPLVAEVVDLLRATDSGPGLDLS
jgi:signal transduction histidine kinase